VGPNRGGSGGRNGATRGLGGEAERGQQPSQRAGLRHRAQDPARAGAAGADEEVAGLAGISRGAFMTTTRRDPAARPAPDTR
jgi:hypothetical protein